MSLIEIIAAVSGLLCVILTIRQNIWSWAVGLVQVALYVYIFYDVKLYSDAILQIFFIITSIYGWYKWLHGGENRTELKVSKLNMKESIIWAGLLIILFPIWGKIMQVYLNAAAPYPDALILVGSIIATYLMAKKKIECWLFWVTVDVMAIGTYTYKHLYITAGLYCVFLVLAVIGYREWRKAYGK